MTNLVRKLAIGAAVVGGLAVAGYLAVPAMAMGGMVMSGGNRAALMQNMGSMMNGGDMSAMMQRMGGNMQHMGGMMQNMGDMNQMHEAMGQMHEAMPAIHDQVVAAAAGVLGMTPAEVSEAMFAGKSLTTLATEKAVDPAALTEAVQQAHRQALDAAVAAGTLTQEQADLMTQHMGSLDHMSGNMMSQSAACHGSEKPAQ